jgi:predicted dehydrogenase
MQTFGDTIGWGVLGPGRIARSFATDLLLVPDARLVATGSRNLERARAFADEYGVPGEVRAHGSYEELVADPAVDVVYVASPHALHEEHTMLALEAGKHVLCEKPMTLEAATTERLFAEAHERGLFLMEAMWMATHPVVRTVLRLLEAGEHGRPLQVHADLGFPVHADPTDRLLDPALGGGVLLDMGIYPLTLAHLALGEPESLVAVAVLAESGIDLDVAIAGRYGGGATAALTASMTAQSPRTATIATDIGCFHFPREFHAPARVRWEAHHMDGWETGGVDERWIEPDEPVVGAGYGNEVLEVHRCLREGATSSSVVPPGQTVSLMRQLDDVRQQIGVHYQV